MAMERTKTLFSYKIGFRDGLIIAGPTNNIEKLFLFPAHLEKEMGHTTITSPIFIFRFPEGIAEYRWHAARKSWLKLENENLRLYSKED